MRFTPKKSKKCRRSLLSRLKAPIAGLCLSIGLVAINSITLSPVYGAEFTSSSLPPSSIAALSLKQEEVPHLNLRSSANEQVSALDDGVYLYGQVAERDQLGVAYLVFEVTENDVIGAFYMPHSSFDCFYGEFEENQLSLQITDSYEQVTFPYSIALNHDSAVATSGDITASSPELLGFSQINSSINENDYRILNVCKADQQLEI